MAVTVAARRSAALLAWLRNRGGALAIFVLLFLLWEFAVRLTGVKEYLLSPPSKVWTEFWRRHELVTAGAWVTTREILAGFALAVVVSIPLALRYNNARRLSASRGRKMKSTRLPYMPEYGKQRILNGPRGRACALEYSRVPLPSLPPHSVRSPR